MIIDAHGELWLDNPLLAGTLLAALWLLMAYLHAEPWRTFRWVKLHPLRARSTWPSTSRLRRHVIVGRASAHLAGVEADDHVGVLPCSPQLIQRFLLEDSLVPHQALER